MQRLKSPGSTQNFLSTHAAVSNTIDVQRHLTSAQTHRTLSAVKNGCGRHIGFSADGGSISARIVVMRARQSMASQASILRKL